MQVIENNLLKSNFNINDVLLNELTAIFFQIETLNIETVRANNKAIKLLESLTSKYEEMDLGKDHKKVFSAIIEKLSEKISSFEDQEYMVESNPSPIELINFLMETNNLEAKDIVECFGSRGYLSDIMNGKRKISQGIAIKLGRYFNLKPSIFMEWK